MILLNLHSVHNTYMCLGARDPPGSVTPAGKRSVNTKKTGTLVCCSIFWQEVQDSSLSERSKHVCFANQCCCNDLFTAAVEPKRLGWEGGVSSCIQKAKQEEGSWKHINTIPQSVGTYICYGCLNIVFYFAHDTCRRLQKKAIGKLCEESEDA